MCSHWILCSVSLMVANGWIAISLNAWLWVAQPLPRDSVWLCVCRGTTSGLDFGAQADRLQPYLHFLLVHCLPPGWSKTLGLSLGFLWHMHIPAHVRGPLELREYVGAFHRPCENLFPVTSLKDCGQPLSNSKRLLHVTAVSPWVVFSKCPGYKAARSAP